MENKESKMIRVVEYEVFKKFTDTVMVEFEKLVAENENMIHQVNGLIERYKVMDEAHRRKVWIDKSDEDLQEAIASYLHISWSVWMKHVFEHSTRNDDGTITISARNAADIEAIANIEYKNMAEDGKEYVRRGAREIIKLL